MRSRVSEEIIRTAAAGIRAVSGRDAALDEFLDVFTGSETRPQIEIKTKDYESLPSVVDAVRAHGMEKSAIIISFDLKQLQVIREYDSEIELWYLVYRIKQKDLDDAKALGNCWLSADRSLNGEKTIGMTLSQNVPLSLWTVDTIKDAIDEAPPELVADLIETGICLSGGGAQILGLPDRLNDELGIRVWVADDPMTSVARGAGAILESEEALEQFRASVDRFSSPR